MNYAKDIDKLTDCTIIITPSTKEECIREIVHFSKKYATAKWYQYKKPYLDEIKFWAKELIKIN